MPFSNSIWGTCWFESSSGHHKSRSIEFRPCFQNYSIFNLSWSSFHLLSPLWCFLWQKTQIFPDLMQCEWCLLTSLLFWFATGLSRVRVTGILHSPAVGESQYLMKWLFWHHFSSLTGLLYISTMSCFTPCSVGWAQGDGFAQCRFKSNPIREHLHTQKNNTHKGHLWAAASSGFSCRIRAVFCSWCI